MKTIHLQEIDSTNAYLRNYTPDPGAGFQTSTNKITIIDHDERVNAFELKSKQEVAKDIVDHLKMGK